ncbi:MAG: MBL fold metallo-hydrolase [Chlamydiota bacterium]
MKGTFRFLGTGGSMGVPVIGCHCNVCRSSHPKDKRLRSAGLISMNGKTILLDCGPDFRQQALKYEVDNLDGVIITHAHYDHTSSIDELRVFYMRTGEAIPCLVSKDTSDDLIKRFDYIFRFRKKSVLVPKIELVELKEDRGEVVFEGIKFRYFTYEQVKMKVNGFRLGNFAYVTDIHDYPESIYEDLDGVDFLVVSALRFTPSHIHLTVDEAVEFAHQVGAKKTWLTHIAHELQHEHANAYLPPDVRVAYDGLELDIMGE